MYLNDIAEAEQIMCQGEQMIRRGYTTSERLFWKVEWEMMSMEAKGIRMDAVNISFLSVTLEIFEATPYGLQEAILKT